MKMNPFETTSKQTRGAVERFHVQEGLMEGIISEDESIFVTKAGKEVHEDLQRIRKEKDDDESGYFHRNAVAEYIRDNLPVIWNQKKSDIESVIEDFTDEDIQDLASSAINSVDARDLFGLMPKEFWRDERVRSTLVLNTKEHLSRGYFRDDEGYLAAEDYLDVGGIAIEEVKDEAIKCLRSCIRRGDVVSAHELISRLKTSGIEVRISTHEVIEGYESLLLDESPYLDGIQRLYELTKVKIDPNGPLSGAIDDAFIRYIETEDDTKNIDRLTEIIGAKPDWNGRLEKKVRSLVWDYLGIGRYGYSVNMQRIKRILRGTGVRVEFDAWQQEQIQKMYAENFDYYFAEEVFEFSRLLGVKFNPKKSEEVHSVLLNYAKKIVSGYSFHKKYTKESLQTRDRLDTNWASTWNAYDNIEKLVYAYRLRKLRQEVGQSFFHEVTKQSEIIDFIGYGMGKGFVTGFDMHMGTLFVEELTGLPFEEFVKRPDMKKFVAIGAIYESEKKEDFWKTVYKKNGGQCVDEFNEEHRLILQEGADPIEVLKCASEDLPNTFWKEQQKIMDKMLAGRSLNRVSGYFEKLTKEKAGEWLTEHRMKMIVWAFCEEAFAKRFEQSIDAFPIPKDFREKTGIERIQKALEEENLISQEPEALRGLLEKIGNSENILQQIRPIIKKHLPKLFLSAQMDLFQGWIEFSGVRMERAKTRQEFIEYFKLTYTTRDRAIVIQNLLPTGKERDMCLAWLRTSDSPEVKILPELLNNIGPSARKEFCPYEKQIPQLIRMMSNKNEDMTALVPYVRMYGAQPIPGLFQTFIVLEKYRIQKKQGKMIQIPSKHREKVDTFLRVHDGSQLAESASPEEIEEIYKKFQEAINRLRQELISDQVPKALDSSSLHMDLLNAMIPVSGSYGSYQDRGDRITQWRATVHELESEGRGQESRLPSGYEVQRFQIGKIGNSSASLEALLASSDERERMSAETERLKKIDESIEKEAKKETLTSFLVPLRKALEEEVSSEDDPQTFDSLFLRCEMRALDAIAEREQMLEKAQQQGLEEKKIQGIKIALKKLQNILDLSRRSLGSFQEACVDQEKRKKWTLPEIALESMVRIFGKEVLNHAAPELNRIVMMMAKDRAPEHVTRIKDAMKESTDGKISTREREAWTNWFEEEALEHLTKQNERPISKEALETIQKVLRLNGIRESLIATKKMDDSKKAPAHPFYDVIRKFEKERISGQGNTETTTVGYYPVHGMGRIFSADLANACYNKLSHNLARNEYQNLHADLLVEEGEGRIDILGSTLWIEGKTRENKKVLLIRALNPRDDVLNRELRADHLVDATIERAIFIAKARNMDEVRLCHDHCGGHSTNRNAIFQAEMKLIQQKGFKRATEDLVETRETSFNGYNVYRANETVVVWQREELAKR
ncbi:hypothetical protein IT408_00135 [Candidatus Uhrbacteria bacterium]|nr:hypothetical protein [Candidatus Uhrbacteria bacterium]